MMSSLRLWIRDGRLLKALAYSFLIGIVLIQFGCGVGPSTPKSDFTGFSGDTGGSSGGGLPPPPSGGGGSGGGEVVDDAGFFIRVTSPEGVAARSYLHRAQNGGGNLDYHTWLAGTQADTTGLDEECVIPVGTSGATANYLCVLEIEELDLYFSAIDIQYHVPSSMCTYVKRKFYSFWKWEPGEGPAVVEYEVLADGTINPITNADAFGRPICAYDYSDNGELDRPDCCHGTYNEIKTTPTGTTSTVRDYPGKEANCAGGQEFRLIGRDAVTGFPTTDSLVTYVAGTGINEVQTLMAPVETTIAPGLTRKYTSNVLSANFHDPAAIPTALTRASTTSNWIPKRVYDFQCLNAAEEIQSRIALLIREWDENPIASGGDPDTGFGNVTEPPPYDDDFLNDRYDWNDIQNDLGLQYPMDDV